MSESESALRVESLSRTPIPSFEHSPGESNYSDNLPNANANDHAFADPVVRSLLDSAPVGIHFVDSSGIIRWANRTELDMLGYEPHEYFGRHIAEFHVDPGVIEEILSRLTKGETLCGKQARLRHKNGHIRVASIDSNALHLDGKFSHTRCFTRDITSAVELEELALSQYSELDLLYRTAPIGLGVLNKEFRFVRVNERMAEINGCSVEQHIGKSLQEIVPDLAVQGETICRRVLQTGQSVANIEITGETLAKPGIRRYWNGSWHPVKDSSGELIGINAVIEEITERKVAELQAAENLRINETLYRLIDRLQRTETLTDVNEAALDAIQSSLRCSRCAILLFDDTKLMQFVASHGLSSAYREKVKGHSPWTIEDTNPTPIGIDDVDAADLTDELKAVVREEGIRALAFIPLVSSGKLIGKFMAYFDAPHSFKKEELELCLSIARQLAFGIEHKRAAATLRANERRFRDMIDALPIAIYTTDEKGYVTHFNPAAVEFSGRTPVLGSDQWCVTFKLYTTDGTYLPHAQCPMAVALKEGRAVRDAEAILERPDGERRWFRPYPTPLKDEADRVIGGINMLLDITEQKRWEHSIEQHANQLALITNTAPVYLAHCDAERRFKFVNGPYAARFALPAEALVGKPLVDVLGERVMEAITPHIDTVLRGERVEFDAEVGVGQAGERFMHCSYAPERNSKGEVVGWVAAIVDITERRRIEEALRTSEEMLKETHRRKDEFLAMLSHELRNPLAPIMNAVSLIKRQKVEDPIVTHARSVIERQAGRLARLVDDLLEVSRITTGRIQLRLERVAISEAIERAVETVRPLIEQHRHTLSVIYPPDPLWVNADGARLEQMLVNLLTNAAKYTNDGGRIEISGTSDGQRHVISVSDSGIGISPDLLPHVFDLFTQSERALDRSQGGLGIGLAIVKRLVVMHGGSVSVESIVGQGSRFSLYLPEAAAPETVETNVSKEGQVSASTLLKVLVVDDNVDAATTLATLIEQEGHHVSTVHDGMTAIDTAHRYRPHIAFVDIGLPKLNGYEVAKRLRESFGEELILVAVTGYGQSSDRQTAYGAGYNHHLTKPVDYAVLQLILKEVPEFHVARTQSLAS